MPEVSTALFGLHDPTPVTWLASVGTLRLLDEVGIEACLSRFTRAKKGIGAEIDVDQATLVEALASQVTPALIPGVEWPPADRVGGVDPTRCPFDDWAGLMTTPEVGPWLARFFDLGRPDRQGRLRLRPWFTRFARQSLAGQIAKTLDLLAEDPAGRIEAALVDGDDWVDGFDGMWLDATAVTLDAGGHPHNERFTASPAMTWLALHGVRALRPSAGWSGRLMRFPTWTSPRSLAQIIELAPMVWDPMPRGTGFVEGRRFPVTWGPHFAGVLGATRSDDPPATVAQILADISDRRLVQNRSDEVIVALIDEARGREDSPTWDEIAAVMGMTGRQAAQTWHSRHSERLRRIDELAALES